MTRPRVALILLALVAAAYPIVAWQVAPGFYEGFCTAVDYNFVKPPPGVSARSQPASGHGDMKVVKGMVNPGFIATADQTPQAQLSFVPGAFEVPADPLATVAIDLKPVRDFTPPSGIVFVTNVYRITASTKLVKNANLRLTYSTVLPAPSTIYQLQPGGDWQAIASNLGSGTGCTDVVATITSLGDFAAGYTGSNTKNPADGGARIGGGQTLPIITAAAILLVVLAGIPLAVVRRRRGGGAEPPAPPGRT